MFQRPQKRDGRPEDERIAFEEDLIKYPTGGLERELLDEERAEPAFWYADLVRGKIVVDCRKGGGVGQAD
jgi:hypothetical protein